MKNLSELFNPDLLRDTGVSAADEMFDDPNVQIRLPWMNNKKSRVQLVHGFLLFRYCGNGKGIPVFPDAVGFRKSAVENLLRR